MSYVTAGFGLSVRKACMLVNLSRTTYGYHPYTPDDDIVLRQRLRDLATERKRFGSPRLHIMLKREGLVLNHKRTERIYREEGLALRKKHPRKRVAGARMPVTLPQMYN